jgi:hypothetical protein
MLSAPCYSLTTCPDTFGAEVRPSCTWARQLDRAERMQPRGPATSAPLVDATFITMPCPRVLCTVIVLYLQLNVWSFTFLSPYATFAWCYTVTTPHATFTAANAPIRIKTKPKVGRVLAQRTHCSPLQNSQTALGLITPPIQWFWRQGYRPRREERVEPCPPSLHGVCADSCTCFT